MAFRDRKGAIAPYTDERAILRANSFLFGHNQSSGFYVHEDGRIHHGALEPNYRNYLTLMAQWYREGLIDRDIFSMNFDTVSAKMTTGQSGMGYGTLNSRMNTWNITVKRTNPGFSLIMIANPSLQKGVRTEYGAGDHYFGTNGLAGISGTSRNQELAARLMDYGYGPEGHMLYNFGIEGVSYTMINGYPTYTNVLTNNPQGWTTAQALGAYARAGDGGPMVQDIRYFEQYMTGQEAKDSIPRITNLPALKHNPPILTPTQAESQEQARIMNDINTYIEEMVTKYILGTENLNTFDTFTATLRRMGIERAIEIQNAAWTRFQAR